VFLVVLRRTGPRWRRSVALEAQEGWTAHAAFMDGLTAEGVVELGGPLEDEERVVLVMRGTSAEEVRARLAADPWSGSMLVVDSVERWTIRLDHCARGHPESR
jgi:uncharacterized protein YciI